MSRLPSRTNLPRLDDRLSLASAAGGDAPRVSPFCLGMVTDPETVLHAFDRGINFFFVSADMHWPLYEATRTGLARLLARGGDVRDRIVVAGVSYCTQPEFCWMPYLELIDAVPRLDRLDVLVAGGAYRDEIDRRSATYHSQLEQRHAGARSYGITFHDHAAAAAALERGTADLVCVRYNPAHRKAHEIVFPVAALRPRHALLYSFKSTSGCLPERRLRELGVEEQHWRPRAADYYRYALTSAELDGLLCSPRTPDEVDEMATALTEGPLSEGEQAYLLDLAELDSGRARLGNRDESIDEGSALDNR